MKEKADATTEITGIKSSKRRTKEKRKESHRNQREKVLKELAEKDKQESPAKRVEEYRWQPGQSGNPLGRPKGAKGKLTLLREAVHEQMEEIVLENLAEVVQTTVALAKAGDPTCLKIIWDRTMPAKRAIEEDKGKEDKLNISITIKGMETKIEETIDAEYEEVVGDMDGGS